jgi:hypothetical protein
MAADKVRPHATAPPDQLHAAPFGEDAAARRGKEIVVKNFTLA